jgi:hypothetical protein
MTGPETVTGPVTEAPTEVTSPVNGERAVPYLCPFCGEEDLRPLAGGDVPGLTRPGWHCRSCLRVFSLNFHGVHRPVHPTPEGER